MGKRTPLENLPEKDGAPCIPEPGRENVADEVSIAPPASSEADVILEGFHLEELQRRVGTAFHNPSLLRRALTHRSFSNEHPDLVGMDNERLEFLGDAILDFLAGAYLFEHYPEMQEGELTSLRAALVRTETLAEFAEELDLGRHLLLGRGEEAAGGRRRPAILCGAFEALVGALYVDQGLAAARRLFERLAPEKARQTLKEAGDRDPKSELQELAQMASQLTPRYITTEESGPDHAKRFTVEVWIGDRAYGQGTGPSKQKAAREAARAALGHPEILALARKAQESWEQEDDHHDD